MKFFAKVIAILLVFLIAAFTVHRGTIGPTPPSRVRSLSTNRDPGDGGQGAGDPPRPPRPGGAGAPPANLILNAFRY
ncbi:unnamed protein product, partial [Iphiclides podalirius]